jgi:hypothetical protein
MYSLLELFVKSRRYFSLRESNKQHVIHFLKFGVEVGVELSIVNAHTGYGLQFSCLYLTFLHEWCALNRLSNAYFDVKLKKKKKNILYIVVQAKMAEVLL